MLSSPLGKIESQVTNVETLMPIGIAMTAGLLLSRLVKKFKLPAVTGYLIAGILVGPYCLGQLATFTGVEWLGFADEVAVENNSILSKVALGFIAFAIGDEFRRRWYQGTMCWSFGWCRNCSYGGTKSRSRSIAYIA